MARILVYATQLLNTGGIESHIFEFSRIMSFNGHEIDIVVPKCRLDLKKKVLLKSFCSQFYFFNANNLIALLYFLLLRSILLCTKKYDTLYTNGQGNTIFWCSRIFRYRQWIHHHHTSGDVQDIALWSTSYFSAIMKCSELVVCSERIQNILINKLNRKIITIPVFSRDLKKSNIQKSKSKIRFGYFGRLINEKGINLLCQLSKDPICKHISFHIWGTGSAAIINTFREFPNLVYHGAFNDKEELQKIVSYLDGYLLLSTHHEGLPVSLLEAMSAGLPWLSTDKGGVYELFVSENATRIISANCDYSEIRKEVLKFAEDCFFGSIDFDQMIELYKKKYIHEVVLRKWNSIL